MNWKTAVTLGFAAASFIWIFFTFEPYASTLVTPTEALVYSAIGFVLFTSGGLIGAMDSRKTNKEEA